MTRPHFRLTARPWRPYAAIAAVAVLVAQFARLALETPPLLFAAALVPALLCGGAAVAFDRGAHRPRRLLAVAFFWGVCVAPVVALTLNGALRAWLGAWLGASAHWAPVLGGPVVEEAAKAAALLVLVAAWRGEVRGVADGITYGALVGAGFTMAENLFYFAVALLSGGAEGLAESVYLRAALGGFTHATFTASTGAGIGWACRHGGAARILAPLLGFALAVAQHAAWNAIGAPWLDTATCAPRAPVCTLSGRSFYWLVTAPAIVLLFIGPGLTALLWLARRDRGRDAARGVEPATSNP